MTTKESWVDIKGFEGKYKLSISGKVLSINGKYKGEKEMSGYVGTMGYLTFCLRKPGQKRMFVRLHRLLALHFIPNPNNYKAINHKDGNKLNNDINNLEWCTLGQNVKHAVEIGLHDCKGENHVLSKLTKQDVIFARRLAATGITHKEIAENHLKGKVSRRQLTDVINGKNWGWLKPSLNDILTERA